MKRESGHAGLDRERGALVVNAAPTLASKSSFHKEEVFRRPAGGEEAPANFAPGARTKHGVEHSRRLHGALEQSDALAEREQARSATAFEFALLSRDVALADQRCAALHSAKEEVEVALRQSAPLRSLAETELSKLRAQVAEEQAANQALLRDLEKASIKLIILNFKIH